MKKDTWLFALIAILLLITLMHGANAQSGPLKNKYKVKVKVMGGREFSGLLIGASRDSLVIMETKGIVVGCQVKVFLTADYFVPGELVGISDSTIVLNTGPTTNQVISYSRIKGITIKSYPKNFDKDTRVRTSFSVLRIATIRLAAKGSGARGFLVGGLTAAALGFGIGYASGEGDLIGPGGVGLAFAILAFPVGGLVGSAIGRSGRTYKIIGDSVSYNRALKKVE